MNAAIERVEEGSSGDLQGLKQHDQIFCIDGKNVLGVDAKVSSSLLDDATRSNRLHLEIGVLRPKKFDLSPRK